MKQKKDKEIYFSLREIVTSHWARSYLIPSVDTACRPCEPAESHPSFDLAIFRRTRCLLCPQAQGPSSSDSATGRLTAEILTFSRPLFGLFGLFGADELSKVELSPLYSSRTTQQATEMPGLIMYRQ